MVYHQNLYLLYGKTIKGLHLHIYELHKSHKHFHQLPQEAPAEAAECKARKELTELEKSILTLGWVYGYMMNMCLHKKEFVPQKSIKEYNPKWRFGLHILEGNFWEVMAWLLKNMKDLYVEDQQVFIQEVSDRDYRPTSNY